jgi:hypothetical protein
MKKWMSILLAIVFIVSGVTGSIFVHNTMKWRVIDKTSTLADAATADSQTEPKDLKSIIKENQELVFLIEVQSTEGEILGSGFLYDNQGDVITNAHVVEGASAVRVTTADSVSYQGKVIGIGATIDVALIRVPELAGKTAVEIDKGRQAAVGDGVIALGSPLGLQNTATTGIISGLNRNLIIEKYTYNNVYQISAPISPGNSGGPLFDEKTGQVIGINSAKMGDETIGFTIPIDQVIPLVDGWAKNPAVPALDNSNNPGSEPPAAEPTVETAKDMVRKLYDSINNHDYVTAYSLLGSDWQSKVSYEDFRYGYMNTVSVQITGLSASSSGDNFQISITIEAEEQIGDGVVLGQYKASYNLGQENNQLKILQGTAKKI